MAWLCTIHASYVKYKVFSKSLPLHLLLYNILLHYSYFCLFSISVSVFQSLHHCEVWLSVCVCVCDCPPTLTFPSVPAVNSRVCVPSSAIVEISALSWQRWNCLTFWPVSARQQITEEAESLLTTCRERARISVIRKSLIYFMLRERQVPLMCLVMTLT